MGGQECANPAYGATLSMIDGARYGTPAAHELAEQLDRFSGATYVFATPDGEGLHAEDWPATHWRPAVVKAGLAPLRPHDLKHTGVAFLAAAGVDPSEIARRAGHASVAFTSSNGSVTTWSSCRQAPHPACPRPVPIRRCFLIDKPT